MFLRESEGVYLFGSRRIAVRVDNDKINIRVGANDTKALPLPPHGKQGHTGPSIILFE